MIQECRSAHALSNQEDGELVQQALQGNEQAFEVLVRRYDAPLFSFIQHILEDYDRSCDVHQHVLFQLYMSLPTLSLGKPLKPWLFRVARNRCIDEIRRKHSLHFSEIEGKGEGLENELYQIVDQEAQPEFQFEQRDLQASLLQAIGQLPSHYQPIVLLRYAAQLTFPEIGRALHIPASTAKTYFHRASCRLRELLCEKPLADLFPGYYRSNK